MHIRVFDVSHDVPIGDVSGTNPGALPQKKGGGVETEVPEDEKEAFDVWLRDLWRMKDSMIARYLETGTFAEGGDKAVVIPVKMRGSGRR
jgi:hypothetical protein